LTLTNSADVENDLIVGSAVDLLHINVIGAAGELNRIDGADQIDTNILVTGGGNELDIGLSNGAYDFAGGIVDASGFSGGLHIALDAGSQTVIGGSGNDLVIDQTNGAGAPDLINFAGGGNDEARFEAVNTNSGGALTGAYHHVSGYSNDLITVENNPGAYNLDDTHGNTISAADALNTLEYVAGTNIDGDQQGWNFIRFNTQVNTALDTAQTAFEEAIGNGQIALGGGNFDHQILGAFYDQTNSQMVLFDIHSGNATITKTDHIDVIATVSMSYADFLAANNSNLHFV